MRHSLSDHPEIACGQEGSFFGRGYDHEEIPVYTGPVSSLTRALAVSRELKIWHALPWNQWSDGYEEDLRNLCSRSRWTTFSPRRWPARGKQDRG